MTAPRGEEPMDLHEARRNLAIAEEVEQRAFDRFRDETDGSRWPELWRAACDRQIETSLARIRVEEIVRKVAA